MLSVFLGITRVYLLGFYLVILSFILFTFRFLEVDEQLFYLVLFSLLFLPIPFFFLVTVGPLEGWLHAQILCGISVLALSWLYRWFREQVRLVIFYELSFRLSLLYWSHRLLSSVSSRFCVFLLSTLSHLLFFVGLPFFVFICSRIFSLSFLRS